MAPEVMLGTKYDTKADVYSFGILLWEVAARLIPFVDMDPKMIPDRVTRKNKRPAINALASSCPEELR